MFEFVVQNWNFPETTFQRLRCYLSSGTESSEVLRKARDRLITFYHIVFFVVIRRCVLQISFPFRIFIYKTLDVNAFYVKVLACIDWNALGGWGTIE